MEHGPIANPVAVGRIRRIEQGLELRFVQVGDQPGVCSLIRDRQDAPDLLECGGFTMLHKAEEGSDRRQADVACLRRVPACTLEMLEKRGDQRRVQLLQHQSRWHGLEPAGSELEQRLEAVGVRIAGVRTGGTMARKVLAQKGLDMRRQGAHG